MKVISLDFCQIEALVWMKNWTRGADGKEENKSQD
jgi:hypothetical protein